VSSWSHATSWARAPASSSVPDDRPAWWSWAVGATCVVVALGLWLLVRDAGLQFDDFGNLRLAGELGTLDFVFNPVFDHFAPGHRILTLLQLALGPTDVADMHAVLVVVHVVALGGLLSILSRFYGPRPWLLLLVLVAMFATVSLAVDQWFAAALHQVPALAASTWGIRTWIHHVDTGRRRWAVASVLMLTVGLAFVGKALLAFGLVFLLDQLVLRPTHPSRLLSRVGREWQRWSLFVAPVVVYLLVSTEAVTPLHPLASPGVLATAVRETWLTRFTPSLFGVDLVELGLDASANTAVQVLLQGALLVVVAYTLWRRPDAARPLAILVAVVVVNAVLVASSRVTTFGVASANSHRYWLEPLWYATFLLPWAWSRPDAVPAVPSSSTDGPPADGPPADGPTADGPPQRWPRGHGIVGAVVLMAVLVSTGVFAVRHQDQTVAFEARAWLESIRATTATAEPGLEVVNDSMPPAWSPPWSLEDMGYLLPNVTFTGSGSARLVTDGILAEPDFEPFYDTTGALFATNTLTTFGGTMQVDGTRLCTISHLDADVLLAPPDQRRFVRLRLSGGRARISSRTIGAAGPPGVTEHVYDTRTAGSEVLFPIDVLPITATGITVTALGGEPACIDEIALGTLANAPVLAR